MDEETRRAYDRAYYAKRAVEPEYRQRIADRKRREAREKRELMQAHRSACVDCGETHPACLDFHHRDPKQKSFSIGKEGVKFSKERILAEIAKCDVLCANCHRKRHWRNSGDSYM